MLFSDICARSWVSARSVDKIYEIVKEAVNNKMSKVDKVKDYYHRETKQILILGSGFAGIEVLKRLQKRFKSNKNIEITLVSKDNFLLFTPMLPEVASGMIETRHTCKGLL